MLDRIGIGNRAAGLAGMPSYHARERESAAYHSMLHVTGGVAGHLGHGSLARYDDAQSIETTGRTTLVFTWNVGADQRLRGGWLEA